MIASSDGGVLEYVLIFCGGHLAHRALYDCPRAVLSYFAALPLPRSQSVGAPIRLAAFASATLGLLVWLHEASGVAYFETRAFSALLGDHAPHRRDELLWLNLVAYPVAAFWLHIAGLRWWIARRTAPTSSESPLASIVIGTLISLVLCIVAGVSSASSSGFLRHNLPGLILLTGAAVLWRRDAATPIAHRLDSTPDIELP